MRLGLCHYFFKQALLNIMGNRVVHVIGLSTMVVSLVIFGTFLFLFANINTWIQGWGNSLTMSVYLQDGISETKKDAISSLIMELPSSEIKRFISKEDALKDLKYALGPQAGLLEGLSRNPLPASFEVAFKNAKEAKITPHGIKKKISEIEGVGDVQYSEDWLTQVDGIMEIISLIGFVIGGLLCVGVLLIETNTIKLAIYSRKDEIQILKLVGATDWFVKIPFLLEGLIQGICGGILALVTLVLGYVLLSTKKMVFFDFAVLDFIFLPAEYIFLILLISIVLGMFGSIIAVGRFFDA